MIRHRPRLFRARFDTHRATAPRVLTLDCVALRRPTRPRNDRELAACVGLGRCYESMTETPETDEEPNDDAESDENAPVLDEGEELVQLPGRQVVIAPHSDDPPDYHKVVVPEKKPRGLLNTYERRAVLLDRIQAAGHPRALSKTYGDLADEFDTSKSVISNDMARLSEYVAENLEREHVSIADAVFRGAIRDLVQDGERARAAEITREWYEWLADMGEVERVADDVNLNISSEEHETDAYEIVESEPVTHEGEATEAMKAADGLPTADDEGDGDT